MQLILFNAQMQLQRKFQSVTGIGDLKCVKDEWPNWIKKIRGVGEVEGITRKMISVLVKRIDEASENGMFAFLFQLYL